MKHIKQFENFLNEKASPTVIRLIDILVNSMEHYDEDSFMDLADEMELDPEVMKEIYNGYWQVHPMDQTDWDTREWTNWLKKEYRVK
jgi:hypothetical protein